MTATFSQSQIDQFLKYIQVPEDLHHAPPSPLLLKTLHTHMISACPYENLSIHYNPLHAINLDPQYLFEKIVLNARGRGGYCMELAIFFYHMLRSLGFQAYTVGVRTRPRVGGVPQGDFPGWMHIVNIVTFHTSSGGDTEERYHVDVAFGGDGPVTPLPLTAEKIQRNLGQQEVRLVRDWIPTQTHRVEQSKLWIYQYRNDPAGVWNSFYAFPDCEFMARDWDIINSYASTSSHSWHTYTVLMVKFLRRKIHSAVQDQEIYGKRMLVGNVVKENLGGKTRVVKICETEAERVEALHDYFDVHLTEEEIQGIKGWTTDLDKDMGIERLVNGGEA